MLWYYIFSCNFMIQFYYNFEAEDRPTGDDYFRVASLKIIKKLFEKIIKAAYRVVVLYILL